MKYLRRGIWYLASRLLVICLVFGLIITVFYYAMNLTNIQIIVKDGMAGRAKYIMGISTDRNLLTKYFQNSYLDSDSEIAAVPQEKSPYANYNIRGIDHRLDMGFLWVWPWENAVRVNITERIPRIDGRVKGLKADEVIAQQGQDAIYPPDWPEMTYRALLVRENGQWKIRNLTPVQ
ncbi:hypothetical protein JNO48_02145 [Clostridiales bacterium]|nr:hypothetical protein JNO48_02145 [Clostridiales bacterium]